MRPKWIRSYFTLLFVSSILKHFPILYSQQLNIGIPALFTVGINIIASVLRLRIVSNRKPLALPTYKTVSLILVLISAVFYLPNLINRSIVEVTANSTDTTTASNGTTVTVRYIPGKSEFGSTTLGKILVIIVQVTRGHLCAFIIIVVNVLTKIRLSHKIRCSNHLERLFGKHKEMSQFL